MNLVVVDTETGGLDPSIHSILSVGMVLVTDKKIVDSKEWLVAEKDYNVTKSALEVNKIDLTEHAQKAISPSRILSEIKAFVPESFKKYSGRAILCGHNINFDVSFLKRLAEQGGYKTFLDELFSYRFLDTATILQYLYLRGELSSNIASLADATKHFGIINSNAHSALADAQATAELLIKLMEPKLIKQGRLFD